MTKVELVNLLKTLNVPVTEGVPEDSNMEKKVRICYWDYLWEPLTASGNEYNTLVTYQISFISELPRCRELIELKHKLNELDIHPSINHEYNIEDRRWHSYFSIEVLENI